MGKRKAKNPARYRSLSISSDGSCDTDCGKSLMEAHYFEPRTMNQELFLKSLRNSEIAITVTSGHAGTGKTLLSCQEGMRAYIDSNKDGIIITRPAICADEDLGFLPGDIDDKMRPFIQPIRDCLEKVIPKQFVDNMIKRNEIQIVPLAYMRGRTFENKFIIADEMQNSTVDQMKMLLTRIGCNSKLVVVGDPNQTDRNIRNNGLGDLIKRIEMNRLNISRIQYIKLESKDIQRERVVEEVLNYLYVDKVKC
tara:strand:+ start:4478 stop:5233 length:756 start_codon:yes stop_codon:yes gene_type:complete